MALQLCRACTTRFSVGAKKCPQCKSTDFLEYSDEAWHELTGDGTGQALPDAVEGDNTDRQAGPAYEAMTVADLRDELGRRDLVKTGTKPELIERLADAEDPADS